MTAKSWKSTSYMAHFYWRT